MASRSNARSRAFANAIPKSISNCSMVRIMNCRAQQFRLNGQLIVDKSGRGDGVAEGRRGPDGYEGTMKWQAEDPGLRVLSRRRADEEFRIGEPGKPPWSIDLGSRTVDLVVVPPLEMPAAGRIRLDASGRRSAVVVSGIEPALAPGRHQLGQGARLVRRQRSAARRRVDSLRRVAGRIEHRCRGDRRSPAG